MFLAYLTSSRMLGNADFRISVQLLGCVLSGYHSPSQILWFQSGLSLWSVAFEEDLLAELAWEGEKVKLGHRCLNYVSEY